jgi:hypothetical protein
MGFVELPFEKKSVRPEDVSLPKTKEFIEAVLNSRYTKLVECYLLNNNDEVVVIDTEPEVGQTPSNDIKFLERLAIQFTAVDDVLPWAYALRADFPIVSHLNSMPFEFPRCLCLYELPYEELRLDWRATAFLERIRDWLKETADGTLHKEDQPLEPFFISTAGSLILTESLDEGKEVFLNVILSEPQPSILLSHTKDSNTHLTHYQALPLVINTGPQIHGIIRRTPKSLLELNTLLAPLGIDLIENHLKSKINSLNDSTYHSHKLLIILVIPKKRTQSGEITSTELLSFVTAQSILQIGLAVKCFSKEQGMIARTFPPERFDPDETSAIGLDPLRVYLPLNRRFASQLNNIPIGDSSVKLALIGVGALGSQVFESLTRMGYGKWTIIDSDILLPHNLSRHSLLPFQIGFNKSLSMSAMANDLLNDKSHSKYIIDNFLRPKDEAAITQALTGADAILDISASLPVARKLSHQKELLARRLSFFLNPSGTDLVILAENKNRTLTLDCLEMQYYRLLITVDVLQNHLKSEASSIRYSSSCRDVTSHISQDNVAILSGVASKAIIKAIKSEDNSIIGIWQTKEDGSIHFHETSTYKTKTILSNEWSITMDEYLIDKITSARRKKLPTETGGVLIGSYDLSRRIIYVVDSILSPKDSKEYPNAYYRGIDGLSERLNEISQRTAGNLMYIGEWHSHPDGISLSMSDDDKKLFGWISGHMKVLGYPPLMIIVGDHSYSCFVSAK